jgi:hypothetical protein
MWITELQENSATIFMTKVYLKLLRLVSTLLKYELCCITEIKFKIAAEFSVSLEAA